MRKQMVNLMINLGLLVSCLTTVFSGLLIQVEYHMGNHGNIQIDNYVFGINYLGWTVFHKISIVVLTALMVFHTYRHWKWYRSVMVKKLLTQKRQVILLSVFFILVAMTGFIPWFIDLMKGDDLLRKVFIEFHDKLALILSVYLILHIVKRLRWFFTTVQKIRNKRSAQ